MGVHVVFELGRKNDDVVKNPMTFLDKSIECEALSAALNVPFRL